MRFAINHACRVAAVTVCVGSAALAQQGASELVIHATDFQSDQGQARILLVNSAESLAGAMAPEATGQAADAGRPVAVADVPIQRGAAAVRFAPLPPGDYGVLVYHDENGNRKLDKSWVGIPKEDVGVSNDYRPTGFPPRRPTWDDIRFSVAPGMNQTTLRVGLMRDRRTSTR